ncbi:MAG TPA: SAM-dependent methyltransferase, partial [Ktedonobacterales bacterium]|nr:SAM-dependent methyltransferase [Ktedonobacterales bacterium]
LFWLRDASLEDAGSLPEPDALARSIVEDLQVALQQFAAIAEDLGAEGDEALALDELEGAAGGGE